MLLLSRLCCGLAIGILFLGLAFAFAGEPVNQHMPLADEIQARLLLVTYAVFIAAGLLGSAILLALPDHYKQKRIMQRAHGISARYRTR